MTAETAEALEEIARDNGVTVYDMILNCAYTIIRMSSKGVKLTPFIKEHLATLEAFLGPQDIANLCQARQQDLEVREAIYVVYDKKKQRRSLVHVNRPFHHTMFDKVEMKADMNTNEMFDKLMSVAYPVTFKALDDIREEMSLPTCIEVVTYLLNLYEDERMTREIAELFSDNQRSEYGRKPHAPETKVRNVKGKEEIIYRQGDLFDEQGQELPQTGE